MQVYLENHSVGKSAVKKLLPFATTYLCESAFSTYTYIKNKYRNKLDGSHDLRIKLTNIPINIPDIAQKYSKQYHSSH